MTQNSSHVVRVAPFLLLGLGSCSDATAATMGITNLQTISQEFAATNVGTLGIAQGILHCPSGTTLVSGGANIRAPNNAIPPYIALVDSYPFENGWAAVARETATPVPAAYLTPGWKITVFATCGTQT